MSLPRITQQDAADVFREALGAIAIRSNFLTTTQDVVKQLDGRITDQELKIIPQAFHCSTVASMGLYTFVWPYERYKNITNRTGASVAFGLDKYNDRQALEIRFPEAKVTTWPANKTGSWFADMVRNSLAHAQCKYVVETIGSKQLPGVELSNHDPKGTETWKIFMVERDFGILVAEALQNFISNTVAGGKYEPLSKLLALDLP